MSQTAISVTDAAKDFLALLESVEATREPAVLVRDGTPVATLNPFPRPILTCSELADVWPTLQKLPSDEANAFADDLEAARATLPPLKSQWD